MSSGHELIKLNYLRNVAIEYAKRWIGTPYSWGGDDFSGFDCSGLVVEVLQAVGILPDKSDFTAHSLYQHFEDKAVIAPHGGCLAFVLRDGRIGHVELLIDDLHTIGAAGGGPQTHTVADAIRQNAYVKIRPLTHLGERVLFVDPFRVEV